MKTGIVVNQNWNYCQQTITQLLNMHGYHNVFLDKRELTKLLSLNILADSNADSVSTKIELFMMWKATNTSEKQIVLSHKSAIDQVEAIRKHINSLH